MENLFFNCEIAKKFDLKGSDRNRLVDPTNSNGEIVLLDENLIQSKKQQLLKVVCFPKHFFLYFSVLFRTSLHIGS